MSAYLGKNVARASAAAARLSVFYSSSSSEEDLESSVSSSTRSSLESPMHTWKTAEGEMRKKGEEFNIQYSGKTPTLFSKGLSGILTNYWSVGIVYGAATAIIYPLVVVKEKQDQQTATASENLVLLFWGYKVLFGMVTDGLPICGYRRKYYIATGWVVNTALLISLSVMARPSYEVILIVLMASNFAYVLADVAADGFMVWVAHREPVETRGTAQSWVYIVRQVGILTASLLTGFFFNGPEYNGDFSFGLTVPQFLWILVALTAPLIPSYFLLNEEKVVKVESPWKILKSFYQSLKRRAVLQIIAWTILNGFFLQISNNATTVTYDEWIKLDPLTNALMLSFNNLIHLAGLWLVKTYFISANWRNITLTSFLVSTFFNNLYLVQVFGILRNKWFLVFTQVSANFAASWGFLVSVYAIVEVSEPGLEAITYAIVTTASNMIAPFAGAISSQLSGVFLGRDLIQEDSTDARMRFMYLTVTVTFINTVSLFFLPLLPRQKKECRELMTKGQKSTLGAWVVIIFTIFCMLYGTILTILAIVPQTKCWSFVGGQEENGADCVAIDALSRNSTSFDGVY